MPNEPETVFDSNVRTAGCGVADSNDGTDAAITRARIRPNGGRMILMNFPGEGKALRNFCARTQWVSFSGSEENDSEHVRITADSRRHLTGGRRASREEARRWTVLLCSLRELL